MTEQANEQPVLIWSPSQKKWISTLIYFTDQPALTSNINDIDMPSKLNNGPVITAGFGLEPSSGYQELLPLGSIFPTSEIWYVDHTKAKKIIERDITWLGAVPTIILHKIYAADGITVTQEIQDEISYAKNILVSNITRTILV